MNIVYIHGLDSDANSIKGALLEHYCQQYYPDINVLRPDLNKAPSQVFAQILSLITDLKASEGQSSVKNEQVRLANTVLIGSSLGGYFSTLISNHIGCPALLLNPSTQPHITLQRFSKELILNHQDDHKEAKNQVFYTTKGGWAITVADLQWFEAYQLATVNYPHKVSVVIKEGDELLNPELSERFYKQQGATVTVQAGGDHRFSDFGEQLPIVISILRQLL